MPDAVMHDVTVPFDNPGFDIRNIDSDRRAIAARLFKDVDLLVLPTTTDTTPTVEEATGNPLALSAENTMFANYYGLPAISVPAGRDANGMPVGLQIVGRPGADAAVLELHLARYAGSEGIGYGFTALNTAFAQDGAFVHLPPGVRVTEPIHLLFLATSLTAPVLAQPRNLIVADRGSEATIIERYAGLGDDPYCTNAVTEIVLGEGAALDHTLFERGREGTLLVTALEVDGGRASAFASHAFAFGGALVRNDARILLGGEGASCSLAALSALAGRDLRHVHVDAHATEAAPGQRQEPVQVRPNDRMLGRGAGQSLQAAQLALRFGAGFVAQRRGGDLFA